MNLKNLCFVLLVSLLVSCGDANKNRDVHNFDKQAHRNGMGLMPENTIASAMNAVKNDWTMEMDVQMSKDKKIVVSHDSFFNSMFCLTPEGDTMTKEDGASRLIYNMPYDSVVKYDVGLKPYPAFPHQKKMPAIKPLLSVLLDSTETYGKQLNHINHYNIEIKSSPDRDGINYSTLEEFIDLTLEIIINKGIAPYTMIQSFDVRALNIIHEKYPEVKTSFLVSASNKKTVEGYIEQLGFEPDIFSPAFSLVTEDLVKAFHEKNILIIAWTPDTIEEIQRLKDMGVDGIITDYPDLYSQLK